MDIVALRQKVVNRIIVPWEGHEAARYYCATTRRTFRAQPGAFKYMRSGKNIYVWLDCPLCDTQCRARGDVGYDRERPQPHMYLLKDAPEDFDG
jgi:hypothetical protein